MTLVSRRVFTQPLYGMGTYGGTYGFHLLSLRPSELDPVFSRIDSSLPSSEDMDARFDELAVCVERSIVLCSGGLPSEI